MEELQRQPSPCTSVYVCRETTMPPSAPLPHPHPTAVARSSIVGLRLSWPREHRASRSPAQLPSLASSHMMHARYPTPRHTHTLHAGFARGGWGRSHPSVPPSRTECVLHVTPAPALSYVMGVRTRRSAERGSQCRLSCGSHGAERAGCWRCRAVHGFHSSTRCMQLRGLLSGIYRGVHQPCRSTVTDL